jgi:hypothetical protein
MPVSSIAARPVLYRGIEAGRRPTSFQYSRAAARGGIEVGLFGALGQHVPAAEHIKKPGRRLAD